MDYSTSYKKGKPVVRRGRKATGLYRDCRVASTASERAGPRKRVSSKWQPPIEGGFPCFVSGVTSDSSCSYSCSCHVWRFLPVPRHAQAAPPPRFPLKSSRYGNRSLLHVWMQVSHPFRWMLRRSRLRVRGAPTWRNVITLVTPLPPAQPFST